MTVHVSDIHAHNKCIAPLRLPYQGKEKDHKWKISVGWAQSAFLLLHARTVHTFIVSGEFRKQKLVKETENQYWLMAKILTLRRVKQEHGDELEASVCYRVAPGDRERQINRKSISVSAVNL